MKSIKLAKKVLPAFILLGMLTGTAQASICGQELRKCKKERNEQVLKLQECKYELLKLEDSNRAEEGNRISEAKATIKNLKSEISKSTYRAQSLADSIKLVEKDLEREQKKAVNIDKQKNDLIEESSELLLKYDYDIPGELTFEVLSKMHLDAADDFQAVREDCDSTLKEYTTESDELLAEIALLSGHIAGFSPKTSILPDASSVRDFALGLSTAVDANAVAFDTFIEELLSEINKLLPDSDIVKPKISKSEKA